MDLRHLRTFQAVATTGRMSAAARQLGLTQPAVSMALGKLEAELGVVLFDRDHRGAHLTESGRALLATVTQVMTILEEGEELLRGLERDAVGRFTLGCPSALGCYLLPRLVPEVMEELPRVELAVRAGSSSEIEAAVRRRELSFGLCTHAVPPDELIRLELFRDEVCVLAPAQATRALHGWGEVSALLRKATLCYAAGMPQAEEILAELERRGVAPARRLDCGDVHMVAEVALARSDGASQRVAVLPRRVASHRHGARLAVLHARLPVVTDTIRLIYRSDMHRTRAAALLTDLLVAQARKLAT
jgi:DNA-binding transcriptional LysR family regulator